VGLRGGFVLAPGEGVRMMYEVAFTLSNRDAMVLGGILLFLPSAQLHTVTPYLQYFVSSVAADDNLVFEGVHGLRRLDFPIDWWLHQWAWVSFE